MRKTLSKSDKDEINPCLFAFGLELGKKDVAILEDDAFLFVDGKLVCFRPLDGFAQASWVPSLHLVLSRKVLPEVVVDMGAVKFVVNGADVMRPGIREIPSGLAQGSLVAIVDEKNRKPLAVGRMLMASGEAQAAVSGKIVATIHYVGDDVWKKGAS